MLRTTLSTLALTLALTTTTMASAQTTTPTEEAAPLIAPTPAPTAAPVTTPAPIVVTPAPAPTVYAAPSYATYGAPTRGRPPRVQVGVRHEMQHDTGLWGLGLGLFLAGWVLDFAVLTPIANAISHDRTDAQEQDAWAWALLPVVGPIVQLGVGAPHPAIPLLTGLMQIGGLVCFVLGLTSTHDAEVPIYAFGDASDPRTARLSMGVAPMADGGYATLTLHTM